MNTRNAPPAWFRIVAVLAILWNVMGLLSFFFEASMSNDMVAELPKEQQDLRLHYTTWTYVVYAIAVFTGTIGSLGLLIKKKWAVSVLGFSLIAVYLQMGHSIFIVKAYEIIGMIQMVMPLVVITIATLLYFLSKKAINKGWIA